MSINIGNIVLGATLTKAYNTAGLSAGLEFIRSPFWELSFTAQTLIPFELTLTIGKRIP